MAQAYPEDPSLDDYKCCVCKDFFKNPKFLPCHHTFCESCIVDLVRTSENRSLPCPVCRKPTNLSESDVRRLQTNFYIPKRLPDDSLVCQSHTNERFRFLCLTCDGKALCCKCLFPGHSGHDVQDFDEGIATAKSKLKEMDSEITGSIATQEMEITQIQTTEKSKIKQQKDLKDSVETLMLMIHSVLEENLKTVGEIVANDISRLQENKASLEKKLSEAKDFREKVRKTLTEGNELTIAHLCYTQATTSQMHRPTSIVRQPELDKTVRDVDDTKYRITSITGPAHRDEKISRNHPVASCMVPDDNQLSLRLTESFGRQTLNSPSENDSGPETSLDLHREPSVLPPVRSRQSRRRILAESTSDEISEASRARRTAALSDLTSRERRQPPDLSLGRGQYVTATAKNRGTPFAHGTALRGGVRHTIELQTARSTLGLQQRCSCGSVEVPDNQ